MKLLSLALLALAACAIPLLLWLWTFWYPAFATDQGKWSDFGSFIGGVISPLLAFASFLGLLATLQEQRAAALRQKTETDDLNYFNHATESIERAYEALAGANPDGTPASDRLAWLTCARLLLSAKEVAKQISSSSVGLLALYDGELEHWRRRFYELLNPRGDLRVGTQATFFSHPASSDGVQIEERSIRVIFEFADWPEGKPDPIDAVPKYTRIDLDAMKPSMSGVREFIESKPRFRTSPGDG
jgi:hypothetical protein